MCIAHWSPPHYIRRLRLERRGVELHLRIFIRSVFTSPGNRAVRTLNWVVDNCTLIETIEGTTAIYSVRNYCRNYCNLHWRTLLCFICFTSQGRWDKLHSSWNYCELLCFIPPPNSSTGKWGEEGCSIHHQVASTHQGGVKITQCPWLPIILLSCFCCNIKKNPALPRQSKNNTKAPSIISSSR